MVVEPFTSIEPNRVDDGHGRKATEHNPDRGRYRPRRSRAHPQAERSQEGSLPRDHQARYEHQNQGVSGYKRHPRRNHWRLKVYGGNQNWVRIVIWVVVAMMVLTLMAALLPTLG